MSFKPGDRVWARSDGTNVAHGWHRAVITGSDCSRGRYVVELMEYSREFKALETGLRPRHDGNDTDLPTTWSAVPWRPAKDWKPREKANT
ncbi:MAG: hypothetical protein ACYDAE_17340 [Steroidobacteraceae bacterium]